jgi:SAM-dependent methyltransferase
MNKFLLQVVGRFYERFAQASRDPNGGWFSIGAVLKRMTPDTVRACLHAAETSPLSDPAVEYPSWYLHRWHFLPEGYLSERSVRLYDRVIRNVYNVASESRIRGALVRRILSAAPQSLLDIGCGPGRLLEALARVLAGTGLHGIDLSPFMLESARQRLAGVPNATLLHGDCLDLPFDDEAFEAVTAVHVVGHIPATVRSRVVGESMRVLRPGGRLYVVDHAWHPTIGEGFQALDRHRLVGGLVQLQVFQRASV